MKGILLAGGSGTRQYPNTEVVSKQLLPVYSKPMIYYSLSNLMLAGIRDIAIITNACYYDDYKSLLGSGEQFGIALRYYIQKEPKGISEALIICEDFIQNNRVCLHLGDNIFYGAKLPYFLQTAQMLDEGAIVFSLPVKNPQDFGVAEIGEDGKVISIVEKPTNPKSNLAIPGIYFLDMDASKFAKEISPSARGELEISDLLDRYLKEKNLLVLQLGRGIVWMDAGNWNSLSDTANFVRAIEERTGSMIGCPEEVAYRMKYISADQLLECTANYPKGEYRSYLEKLVLEVS